ncbi:SubName: Full=Uncharacterized protein {ECO:0000313/EMBL:CCA69417.1} [Serendipita indica DSM 11827]|nr:SubName: Full=Uncharacterized protein {ECO:0000313/EMBL:CCA69417.1} [Serendipita indica DSM 11827]
MTLCRLIRLISASTPDVEAIRNLLAYRLPADSDREAREIWREIIEGDSALWTGIPADRKELIRGFLVYFENEILKRSHRRFAFANGSIGNFFLSACQLFFRSLPSAIFQFSALTGTTQDRILPILVTNHTVTIAADLDNSKRIIGQCNISHPVGGQEVVLEGLEDGEDGNGHNSPLNVAFVKSSEHTAEALEGRIERVYYINAHGNEIYPHPNPEVLSSLGQQDYLVYSCGSLWTSIIPCLALRGVATSIARSPSLRAKILLLNIHNDRETAGYTALDYVQAITSTLNRHDLTPRTAGGIIRPLYPASAFVTHLVYMSHTSIEIPTLALTAMGVHCVRIYGSNKSGFGANDVRQALEQIIASTSTAD